MPKSTFPAELVCCVEVDPAMYFFKLAEFLEICSPSKKSVEGELRAAGLLDPAKPRGMHIGEP